MNTDIIPQTLTAIELVESGLADEAQVLAGAAFIEKLGQLHRELKSRWEAAAIAYMEANGDLLDGEVRYYVGPNKSTKCVDLRETVRVVLTATGGDVDAFTDCLSSSAFKHGTTCKRLAEAGMKEDADRLFVTTETKDIKTGKATGPRVQKFDPRFVKEIN